jgi:hypothetical protein
MEGYKHDIQWLQEVTGREVAYRGVARTERIVVNHKLLFARCRTLSRQEGEKRMSLCINAT